MTINHKWRKRWSTLMFCLCLTLGFAFSAYAKDRIDQKKPVSLELIYQDESQPIAHAGFCLYRVADRTESGSFVLSGDFADYLVIIDMDNSESWRNLAITLNSYAQRDQLKPLESGETDESGHLKFQGKASEPLLPALYLVSGVTCRCNGKVYFAEPFLAWMPDYNEVLDTWSYDVQAIPKFEQKPDSGETDTVTRKVLKVWNDSGYVKKRPNQITVQLLKDGTVYDTVTLTAADNWRYTWENLSNAYQWTVVEQEQKPYTVEISREGITYVVTNTYHPTNPGGGHSGGGDSDDGGGGSQTPDNPSSDDTSTPTTELIPEGDIPMAQIEPDPLPQTGQLWWPVPMLIAAGLLLLIPGVMLLQRSRR